MSSPSSSAPPSPRRYAVVGTGSRAEMFLTAMATTHRDVAVPVALCDPNPVRREYHDRRLAAHGVAVAHVEPADLERLLDAGGVDVLLVCSPDATHARYVVAALDRGVDVVCEKPLATTAEDLAAIADAAARSSARLVVALNYRYAPRNAAVRRLIADGAVGEVTGVRLEWLLDTVHGADYFRRWHRDKRRSGGLLVHKAAHHFDLVSWWLDDVPEVVHAYGDLRFYGDRRAVERGLGARATLGRDAAPDDPFALDLAADDRLRRLYLDAEGADGYLRDRDVFGTGITIEDNLSALVGYRDGATLTYSLNAHGPWEGYRVAVDGTEGRIELDVVERGWVPPHRAGEQLGPRPVAGQDPDDAPGTSDADDALRPVGARLVLQRHWERPQVVDVPEGPGAHGGGDAALLDDLLRGPADDAPDDPLRRQAGYVDGLRSALVGVGANLSIASGAPVALGRLGVPLDALAVAGGAR